MDWQECLSKRIVKHISNDNQLIISLQETSRTKINAANSLNNKFQIVKITLLYDALRELLECRAIQNGYKIYNHECYTSFIKSVLKNSEQAKEFDEIRKIRNKINYYGKNYNKEESKEIITRITKLLNFYKNF